MASALGADKVQRIREAQPDIVVTGNSGCILQIRHALLQTAGQDDSLAHVEVLHPMELLLRSYVGEPGESRDAAAKTS